MACYNFHYTFYTPVLEEKFFRGETTSAKFRTEHNVSIKASSIDEAFTAFENFVKDHNIEDAKVLDVSEPN